MKRKFKSILVVVLCAVGLVAFAVEPSVTINEVKSIQPLDGAKGTITVDYSLANIDAAKMYKVAFDITANGVTKGVTNAAVKLVEGRQSVFTNDTVSLFGEEIIDNGAKVKISLIAAGGAVQLWANGPYWAEANLGEPESHDPAYPAEYGALYKFGKADAAVKSLLGDEWRVPTIDEFAKLISKNGEELCSNVWTTCNGIICLQFFGKTTGYEDKSIVLPTAGMSTGSRTLINIGGAYWSSELGTPSYGMDTGKYLYFAADTPSVDLSENLIDFCTMSVRPVRDTPAEEVIAIAEAEFVLAPPNVPYRAWNETTRQMEDGVCTNYTIVTEETTTFDDDLWYVVTGAVSRGTITVNGSAHLILCDGARLTCDGEKPNVYHCWEPGILLDDPHTLCVYGQVEGTGTLEALGADDCAGIGSGAGDSPTAGGLTVNGGVVLATGRGYGAGIGGSNTFWWTNYGNGGTVTVNGGRVTASGGPFAAGIGGGSQGRGAAVTIRGGTVASQGGQGGFGHGNGYGVSDNGSLTIDGGSVKAATIQNAPTNGANAAVYCVTVECEGVESLGSGIVIGGLEDYGTNDIFAIDGKVYLWLPNGDYGFTVDGEKYAATVKDANTTAIRAILITPGTPLVFDTAEEATNALGRAELKPSDMVEAALGSDEARTTYRNMFTLDVVPTSEDKWAVAALLLPEPWTNVVLSAHSATRQIPVADIAALELGVETNVTVKGCGVPGFYYSLYSGSSVTNLTALASEYGRNVLCGTDKDVEFSGVVKPSDAAGFFSVGVLLAPGVGPSDERPAAETPAQMFFKLRLR